MDCPSAHCVHLSSCYSFPLAWPFWFGGAAQYTHCGLGRKAGKGLAGRLGQPAPDWRVGGGLSRHRAPLFARPAGQLVWDFWEVFFSPFLSFFYLRRIIALSRGSQDSKSLCRTAGQPRDVPLDQPLLPFLLLEAWEEHPYREGEAGYCSRLPVLPVGRES